MPPPHVRPRVEFPTPPPDLHQLAPPRRNPVYIAEYRISASSQVLRVVTSPRASHTTSPAQLVTTRSSSVAYSLPTASPLGSSMAARRNIPYSVLPTEDRDEDNVDRRFTYTPKSLRRIPWKSIALALFLLFLGSSLLFLSYFISTGHMEGDSSQVYGLLFLGILAFLPGFYETRVAYYSWRGAPGFTFAAIPDY